MKVLSFTEARKKLKSVFDRVYEDHESCIVSRKDDRSVVILSLDDYNSLIETNYLLSSPKNAERLLSSLEKARAGRTLKKELIED